MKYCGLVRIENNMITWEWVRPAHDYIDALGGHVSFESYCKTHAADAYIYVEVDDEEV